MFCHLSRLEGLQDRGSWYANRVQKKSMLGEGEKSLGQTPRGWGKMAQRKSFVSYALVPVGSGKSSAEGRWGAGNLTQEHLGPQGAAGRAIQLLQTNPAIQRKSQSL